MRFSHSWCFPVEIFRTPDVIMMDLDLLMELLEHRVAHPSPGGSGDRVWKKIQANVYMSKVRVTTVLESEYSLWI